MIYWYLKCSDCPDAIKSTGHIDLVECPFVSKKYGLRHIRSGYCKIEDKTNKRFAEVKVIKIETKPIKVRKFQKPKQEKLKKMPPIWCWNCKKFIPDEKATEHLATVHLPVKPVSL